jgi:cytochrome c551/c552
MKKVLLIAAAISAVSFAGLSTATAGDLTKKCKSCHSTSKDKVGPSFKKIQAAYGDAATLAAAFESGFDVEIRKVAAGDAKWKKKAKIMSGQYKNLIKKKVAKGKFTYKELADEIFAK